MGSKTKIEWTEKVWNPSIGCSKISEGCRNCYAEKFAKRLKAMRAKDYQEGFKFKILPHRLNYPFQIKKPAKFFVNSMSDLFYEKMPFEFIDKVFEVIRQTPQHTYQILTKRDKIMVDYCKDKEIPPNVWLGVSVENRKNLARIDNLKQVNCLVRFISFEPLLGSVGKIDFTGIHWVIVGGESGIGARLMKREWVEEIFEQCKAQKIPFFFKQWGTWGKDEVRRNKKINGRLLFEKEWSEYPKSLNRF